MSTETTQPTVDELLAQADLAEFAERCERCGCSMAGDEDEKAELAAMANAERAADPTWEN